MRKLAGAVLILLLGANLLLYRERQGRAAERVLPVRTPPPPPAPVPAPLPLPQGPEERWVAVRIKPGERVLVRKRKPAWEPIGRITGGAPYPAR